MVHSTISRRGVFLLLCAAVLSSGCAAQRAPFGRDRSLGYTPVAHLGGETTGATGGTAQSRGGTAFRSASQEGAWEQLLEVAGLEARDERPPPGGPLTPRQAERLLKVLLRKPTTLGTYPSRMAVGHLLRQVLEQGELSRGELLRRVERFSRVAVLRPDGYLAWVRDGRTQQKVAPVKWKDGAFRARQFELGRFYVSNGFVFRLADEHLEPLERPVLVEVYDDADYLSRTLDGAEVAFVKLALALGHLFTHPVDSLVALKELPAGVATLIASSPEYLERFRYMTRGEQVQVVAELSTALLVTKGTVTSTTRTVTGALVGAEATVPVLALSADGALVLERVAVPVGQAARVLGGGPGAVVLLHRANSAGSGVSPSEGPGRWESVKEHMEEPTRRYEKQITGAPEGQVYKVEDVKFDGFKDGVLLEAKGPGYAEHIPDAVENGRWFQGFREMLKQARKQQHIYYAGVYWPGRREPVESYARRAESFFRLLADADPTLGQWFEQANSRAAALQAQFAPDAESLSKLFMQKKYRSGDGEISFSAWNGASDGSSEVNFSCGSPSPYVVDVCVFTPPSRGAVAERLLSASTLAVALHAMALAWEPEWGIATSDAHRDEVLKLNKIGTFVGWVMYFSRRRGEVPPLPTPVRVEPVEDKGTLIVLTPERFTASSPEHVALAAQVQEILERAGLLKPLRPQS